MQQLDLERREVLKNRIWFIFPLIHWVLTFVYERSIFMWDSNSWDIYTAKPVNEGVSNTAQSIILYIFGKIVAAVMIYLLWKGIFAVINKRISKHIIVIFGVICLIVGGFLVLCWPWSMNWYDTFTMYAYSVRMLPWYWHHFLTSALFVGCLSVIPFPFAISLVQFMSFAALMTYIYYRIEKDLNIRLPFRLIIFAVFLLPDTYLLLTQAYRNCFYTILCMYYVAEICFGAIRRDEFHGKDLWIRLSRLIAVGAVLSIWRTEGILIGIVGTVVILFCLYRLTLKEKLIGIVAFFLAMLVIGLPQKIGDNRYYNKDYLAMSTIEGLQAVLNSSDINLSYTGAEEDLAAIDAYVPLDYIRQYGTGGKRGWFYENGNRDFDQSCASAEIQEGYLKAVVRLVIHNPAPYVKKQLNYTLKGFGIYREFFIEEYTGSDSGCVEAQNTVYLIGYDDIYENAAVKAWTGSAFYKTIGMKVHEFNSLWTRYCEKLRVNVVIRLFIIFADILVVGVEIIRIFKRKRDRFVFGILAFLQLVQLGIIAMTVPSAYSLYFYTVLFTSGLIQIIYLYSIFGGRDGARKKLQNLDEK